MRKKLCLTCAQALQKRADIRYTGKRTRMDMCSGCHSKMLVTEYIVPDEPVPITPKPEPKSAAVQYKLGEKLTMTVPPVQSCAMRNAGQSSLARLLTV